MIYPKAVYIGNDLILAKVLHSRMLLPARDISMTPGILFDGFWELTTSKFLMNLIRPGMTVLDIGAAFGYFTLLSAYKTGENGRVISFEADPVNFQILKQNTYINNFHKRTTLVNKAVSDRVGKAKLHYKADNLYGMNSLVGKSDERSVEVDTVTIDSFLQQHNINNVSVIKMDVEGYEPYVMRGMKETIRNSKNLRIVFEFSPDHYRQGGVDPRDFLQEMESYGFPKVRKINESSGKLEELIPTDLTSDTVRMCYVAKDAG